MADTSLIIGNGNWAVKETSLLGYNIIQSKYVPIEMTVSRNTTGTRENSAGKIELGPKNLFSYSQTFDNTSTAGWYNTGLNSTVIPNVLATSAPNGTFTADKLVATAVLGSHLILQTPAGSVSGSTVTASVFAKAAELTRMVLLNNQGGGGECNFILSGAGSYTIVSGVSANIQPYPDGWYRCIITYTPSTTGLFNVHIKLLNNSGVPSFLGNGSDGIYLWGAQLETGTTETEYFPTTDRFNVPRIDYLNSTTSSLLVEPARTNLVLHSQDLSNAYWVKTNVTITANSITSPIVGFTSDSIVENSASNVVFGVNAFPRPSGLTLGTTYSVSFFAKKITRDWCYFNDFNGFQTPFVKVFFNLSTGLVGTSTFGVLNPKMENYDNGWYRCSFQFVATINTSIDYRIASTTSDNTLSYSGTIGQQSISVTACQLEAGINATSYIPTTTLAAGVTRNADLISKTGISSLIGQTEGTIFVDVNLTANTDERRIITVSNGTETQRIIFWTLVTTLYISINAAPSINLGNFPIGPAKIAFAYTITPGSPGSTTYSAKVNTNPLTTGTLGVAPTPLTNINLGSSPGGSLFLNDRIKSVQLYKTALTPGQLATLTT